MFDVRCPYRSEHLQTKRNTCVINKLHFVKTQKNHTGHFSEMSLAMGFIVPHNVAVFVNRDKNEYITRIYPNFGSILVMYLF